MLVVGDYKKVTKAVLEFSAVTDWHIKQHNEQKNEEVTYFSAGRPKNMRSWNTWHQMTILTHEVSQ